MNQETNLKPIWQSPGQASDRRRVTALCQLTALPAEDTCGQGRLQVTLEGTAAFGDWAFLPLLPLLSV